MTKTPETTMKVSPLWGGACQRQVWEYAQSLKRERNERQSHVARWRAEPHTDGWQAALSLLKVNSMHTHFS